jgi:acyl-CoA thioesterase-1
MISKPALLFALIATLGCSRAPRTDRAAAPPGTDATASASARPVLLAFGTSLTAGLGVDPDEAWPALLQARIAAASLPYEVVNAGVSGETSAGALRRVDWLLQKPVSVAIVETGANDGLRGQDPDALAANLQAIVTRLRAQRPPPHIVIVGMQAPPNYGAQYAQRFAAVYPRVAEDNDAVFVPFLLDGVAGIPDLNQADGVHPTARGHQILAETMWRALEPHLRAWAGKP